MLNGTTTDELVKSSFVDKKDVSFIITNLIITIYYLSYIF